MVAVVARDVELEDPDDADAPEDFDADVPPDTTVAEPVVERGVVAVVAGVEAGRLTTLCVAAVAPGISLATTMPTTAVATAASTARDLVALRTRSVAWSRRAVRRARAGRSEGAGGVRIPPWHQANLAARPASPKSPL